MNYGFIDNTSSAEKTVTTKEEEEKLTEVKDEATSQPLSSTQDESAPQMAGKKRKAPPPKWFDLAPEHNSKVYVSNLPNDITEEEFGELMSKCGLVMKDLKTGKLKLKLYRDSNGQTKGDGLCHFIKVSLKIGK